MSEIEFYPAYLRIGSRERILRIVAGCWAHDQYVRLDQPLPRAWLGRQSDVLLEIDQPYGEEHLEYPAVTIVEIAPDSVTPLTSTQHLYRLSVAV